MNTLEEKKSCLAKFLGGLESVMIAYSGGVDSAFLAWQASRIPGLKMLAVLADSPSLARSHFDHAVRFAREHDIPLEIIPTDEMELVTPRSSIGGVVSESPCFFPSGLPDHHSLLNWRGEPDADDAASVRTLRTDPPASGPRRKSLPQTEASREQWLRRKA
jgi:hypothetical protein